jgi:hypothetical protein
MNRRGFPGFVGDESNLEDEDEKERVPWPEKMIA